MSETLDYNSVTTPNTSCETDAVSDIHLGRANYAENSPEISSKIFRHGGPRLNSGGPRENSGGTRQGAGRPRKAPAVFASRDDSILRWYCVRTERGQEIHADWSIRAARFETLFPLEWLPPVAAERLASGRSLPARSERLVPLFPGYIFTRLALSNPGWRHIAKDTMPSVVGIISSSPEKPMAIPDSEIAWLRDGLAANGCWYPAPARGDAKREKRVWVDWFEGLAVVQAGLVVA